MSKTETPSIRFYGFDNDWEQRKFSELYARSSEKNDGSIGMDKNITVATMQFKNDVKVSTTEYLKTYYTFKLGDIAFEGHQSKEFRYGRFVENDIGNGIVSHIFAVFRPIQEYDLYFWKYAINNETLMQRILARSTKASTMMHDLVTNDFLNETFLVPSVKEQKQIGAFLNKLDNLITLHQRKFEKLTNVKKSMLEKMFPQNGSSYPEIRFKGFTDPWEQRKLGDIASDMVAGGDIDKDLILAEGQYPVIANALTGDGIVGYYNKEYRVNAPAVTVTGRGYVGHAKARLVNFTPVVRLLSVKSEHDVFFLENAINTLKIVIESTGVPQLTVPQLAKYEVAFPRQLDEEEHIGAFFKQLDHLITLHQRELEKLQNIKKALLEKMFV